MTAPSSREWLRTAVDRVSVGSSRLAARTAGRAISGVRGLVGRWPGWVRLLLAALVLLRGPGILARLGDRVHERVESGAWTGVLTVGALLWTVAAYRAGGDETESAEDEEPVEAAVEEPPFPSLDDVRASLARVGTPHAHLAVLAADLGVTPDRLRDVLAEWDIPVRAVRMQGRGTSTGVKAGTLLDLSAAPDGVVAAGQPSNNNSNNAPADEAREGLRVEPIGQAGAVVRDPADAVRHHDLKT